MRTISAALIFFIFALGDVSAQNEFLPGYVINVDEDTIRGWIQSSAGAMRVRTCQFKTSENSAVEIYDPADISGYGYSSDDRYFESLSLPELNGEKVFAEKLFAGRADLYNYNDFFYLRKDGVVEKIDKIQQRESTNTGERYVYTHKIYIGTLNRYFSDCLPGKLLNGDVNYTEKDFVDVFKKYSECSKREYHEYKTPRQTRKARYYPLAGLNFSRLEYPGDLDIFDGDHNFFVGAGIEIPIPFFGNRIRLTGEAAYHRNAYRGQREGFSVDDGRVMKDYSVDISLLKLPLALKYDVANGMINPYLKAGVIPFFPLKTTWKIQYKGTTENAYNVKDINATLALWAGLGAQTKIGSRSAFVEVRFESWNDFTAFCGPNGITNNPSSVKNKMVVFGMNF